MAFLRVFPGAALLLFGISAVVLSISVVVVFTLPVDEFPVVEGGQSRLTTLSLTYPRAFLSLCWAYSVAAVVASLGLRHKRRWAYYIWLVLLGLLALWSLSTVASEALNLMARDPGEGAPGIIPEFAVASAIIAIPLGLGISASAILLLRKLMQTWRSAVEAT